jgi:SAM-dependent methyltransferase
MSDQASDGAFADGGFWTPQTVMLRSLRQWVCDNPLSVATALSIDRNPTLDRIFTEKCPSLRIHLAQFPEHDVQNLRGFSDASFDLVYSHQVLEHVPKPWLAGRALVRVLKPGGVGLHTTCAYNPRHGPPAFNDYYRFLPDGLAELFEGVEVLVKAGWGNRQVLLYNLAMNDGHGALGGRRFHPNLCEQNEVDHPWVTWIIFRKH